ncbi:MAG: metallophosphoesterase family protein [Promethearchaeota archaeon]
MEPFSFIHVADLHLGKKQYNLEIRYKDYFNTFQRILSIAVKKNVDFLLIAGDIFDNRKIDPSVLSEVFNIIQNFKKECLKKLDREIPLICIEGNHDNPLSSSKSWMSFLADLNLIILLEGYYDISSQSIIFPPYSEKTRKGGFIKIKDCCIYGLPFYGSFTYKLFPSIRAAIKDSKECFNILMMHFGIKGYDEMKPGIPYEKELELLREKVDYLALGHYHRHYSHPPKEPWIYNPGSIEINTTRELYAFRNNKYDDKAWRSERGIILGKIMGKEPYQQDFDLIEFDNGALNVDMIPNRKFLTLEPIDISQSNSFKDAIILIKEKLKKLVPLKEKGKELPDEDLNKMIIVFSLKGEIPYSRIEINMGELRRELLETFDILDVRISTKRLISTLDSIELFDEEKTINELEKEIFLSIIEQNPDHAPKKEQIMNLIEDLKTELLLKKPNIKYLKQKVEEWSKLTYKQFHEIKSPRDKLGAEKKEIDNSDIDLGEIAMDFPESETEMKEGEDLEKIEEEDFELYEELEIDLDDFIDDERRKNKEKEK